MFANGESGDQKDGRLVSIVVLIALGVLLAHPLPSVAADITNCDDPCTSGTCKIVNSNEPLRCCVNQVLCDGEGPIVLSGGGDLDLNGHTLECACGRMYCSTSSQVCEADSDCPGSETCTVDPQCDSCENAAVDIQGTNSKVKDTGSGGRITGLFGAVNPFRIIDCNLKSGSVVEGVTIDGFGAAGAIVDCSQVKENVIVGTATVGKAVGTGVGTDGVTNNDFLSDNYIADVAVGIIVDGTKGVRVDHNLIQTSGGTAYAMQMLTATGTDLEVKNNVIFSSGSSLAVINGASGTSNKYSANYCDISDGDCVDCVDDGFCEVPTAPFVFP